MTRFWLALHRLACRLARASWRRYVVALCLLWLLSAGGGGFVPTLGHACLTAPSLPVPLCFTDFGGVA